MRFTRSPSGSTRKLLLATVLGLACVTLVLAQGADPHKPEVARSCPRCGYLAEGEWRYCPACGWDLRVLAGEEGAAKLRAIGTSVVGLILTKEPPSLQEVLPPSLYKMTLRYSYRYQPGRSKFFATAFPFLRPGLFVTSARALEWVEVADVRTYNNRIIPAQVLGYDIPSGIGLVKADVSGVVPLAASDVTPRESDLAWAICYPVSIWRGKAEYLPESFHRGRISALGQDGTGLAAFEHFLRTDHTLEEGRLGGAVLDSYGAAAGLVLGSPDPGIAYALPVSDLQAVVDLLAGPKKPERPFYGMGLIAPDDRRRSKFHLPTEPTLPVVAYVIPDSPAQKAGVQPGDLLTAVEGEKVTSVAAAGAHLLKAPPSGGAVSVTVLRQGREAPVSITPTKRPRRVMLSPSDELEESLQANLVEVSTGPTSQQGLRVADLVRGGRGETDGYREGDVIYSVYDKGVRHLADLDRLVRDTNSHIFGEKSLNEDGAQRLSTYRILLGVHTAEKGEKDERPYVNLFPDVLAAPVY